MTTRFRFCSSEQSDRHLKKEMSNQRDDQQCDKEVKMTISSSPADLHDQNKSIGCPLTEARKSTHNLVDDMDDELWCRLPEDLLPKIFARLPFRSLFKIRLLSKAWEAHMWSSSFHLEATSEVLSKWESYSPILCSSMDMRINMVGYSSASRQWERLFSLSYLFAGADLFSFRWQTKSIAGSLLCLKQMGEPGERGILVTNPVLKSWRVLPPHGLMTPFLPAYEIIQLVRSEDVDSSSYKVISISQDGGVRDPLKNSRIPSEIPQDLLVPLPHLRVEIYDSSTGAWTVNERGPVVPVDLHNVSSVYLDGIVYFSLASSRHESFHLFAYNVVKGTWTTIQHPPESCNLVQLVKCGSRVMLVLLSSFTDPQMPCRKSGFGSSCGNRFISKRSLQMYELRSGPDFMITQVSEGPVECIQGVEIVEGIAGDEDSIYLQVFGRPLVVVFNVKGKLWSTVPVCLDSKNVTDDAGQLLTMSCRYFGPWFSWTNSSFQPDFNSFVVTPQDSGAHGAIGTYYYNSQSTN